MRGFLSLTIVLLAAAPAAATQLQFHSGVGDYLLSPQEVPADAADEQQLGLLTHTVACTPPPPGAGLVGKQWHVWYAEPVSGALAYADGRLAAIGGYPGLGADLHLAQDATPVAVVYLRSAEPMPELVVPRVTVSVSMHEGTLLVSGEPDGPLAGAGQTGPHDMLPGSAVHEQVDGSDVYRFEVPIEMETDTVTADAGLFLRIAATVDVPGCEGGLMPASVAMHSSPSARPSFLIDEVDPVRIDVNTTVYDGVTNISVEAMGVWGHLQVASMTLGLTGPHGAVDVVALGGTVPHHCHCTPQPGITYRFQVPTGTYNGTITTFDATGNVTGTFPILIAAPASSQAAPTAPLAAFVVMTIGTVAVARRRKG